MARGNGGVIGSKNLSTFNKTGGVVSLRDTQQNLGAISLDFAIIGGGGATAGYSAGGGGFCLFGSSKSWPMNGSYTITVGAAGGATYANIASGGASYYAPKGNTSSGASYSASWDEGGVTSGDGGPGGGPAYSAGSIGSAGYSSGSGGSGGNGNFWPINGTYYGGGAGGTRSTYGGPGGGGPGPIPGGPGASGLGASNSGGSGASGAVIISYIAASQKFNGGTVSSPTSNNRYFHIFTSSGTLTPL